VCFSVVCYIQKNTTQNQFQRRGRKISFKPLIEAQSKLNEYWLQFIGDFGRITEDYDDVGRMTLWFVYALNPWKTLCREVVLKEFNSNLQILA